MAFRKPVLAESADLGWSIVGFVCLPRFVPAPSIPISFAAFAALFLLQAGDQNLPADRLFAYAPWILLFVFCNAFMEELHFRGLLLKPFEQLLGRHAANLCIALFFTFSHAPVQYAPDIVVFLAILLVLALILIW